MQLRTANPDQLRRSKCRYSPKASRAPCYHRHYRRYCVYAISNARQRLGKTPWRRCPKAPWKRYPKAPCKPCCRPQKRGRSVSAGCSASLRLGQILQPFSQTGLDTHFAVSSTALSALPVRLFFTLLGSAFPAPNWASFQRRSARRSSSTYAVHPHGRRSSNRPPPLALSCPWHPAQFSLATVAAGVPRGPIFPNAITPYQQTVR